MKKTIKNLIIIFLFYAVSSQALLDKEINFEPDNSLVRLKYISDYPNSFNKFEKNSYINFFRLLNKYDNAIIYSLDYYNNNSYSSTDFIRNIKELTCLKGDHCNKDINIKQQINNDKYKQDLRAKVWSSGGDSKEIGDTFAIIFFNSNKTLNTVIDKNDYTIEFYFDKDLINNFYKLSTQYEPQEVEKELIKYNKIIDEPLSCEKELIIYCDILKNRQSKIKKLLINNEISNLKKRLMLDFAIVSRKDSISSMIIRKDIKSLHFMNKKALLYAASFYDLKGILEIIATPDIIDTHFQNGLTALGVAIAAESKNAAKKLINIGAISAGNYYMNFWFKESILSHPDNFEILNYFIFKYKDKTKKPKIISEILIKNIYETGDKNIAWLKKIQNEYPQFFSEIILKDNHVSKELLLASSYLSKSTLYDFLVEKKVNKCLIHKMRKVTKNDKVRHSISFWYINKYEENSNECN